MLRFNTLREGGLTLHHGIKAIGLLLVAGMALLHAARADFELTGPDGRRILLKDDGTWRHIEEKGKEPLKENPETLKPETLKPETKGEAVLRLERKTEAGSSCRYELRLVNNLPYEIRSLVPGFSAHRANGVVYDSVLSGFQWLRPGDSQTREIQFRGITCQEIVRVQVVGGDRCVMGDLDRFAMPDGACLARIRVLASDVVRFDK